MSKGFSEAFAQSFAKPMPNKEKEQEQEQEQEQENYPRHGEQTPKEGLYTHARGKRRLAVVAVEAD